MTSFFKGAPRVGRPFVLGAIVVAAAASGIAVGSVTAERPSPTASLAVAAIPPSTPDLRTPSPTRTLTPTQAPTPTPAPVIATLRPASGPAVPTFLPTPRPTPTPEPRGRAVVYFASRHGVPVAVEEPKASGGQSQSDHVFFRMTAIRFTQVAPPPGYVNVFKTMKAVIGETTVDAPGTVVIGFIVGQLYRDWGVSDDDVKLLLQQIVYTATEEPGIDRVVITQNGGKPAVINGVTYDKPLAREDVR